MDDGGRRRGVYRCDVVAAQAADLPDQEGSPSAPVYVPPPFTWTGFYVGVNAGGIWGTGNTTTTFYNAGFPGPLQRQLPGALGNGASGFIGGGQAGYNFQSGAAVFGIETDFDGTSMSKSKTQHRRHLAYPRRRSVRLLHHQRLGPPELARHHPRAASASSPRRTTA